MIEDKKIVITHARSGMTLIEVVLAIVILAISTISLFALQANLLRGTFKAHALIARITALQNMLVESSKHKWYEQEAGHEKKMEDPSITLVYKPQRADNASSLKQFPHMVIERVTGTWIGFSGKDAQRTVISLTFAPQPDDKVEGSS
jgi:prepilin-type N-terminal cleavage/methylation domain-containing protein